MNAFPPLALPETQIWTPGQQTAIGIGVSGGKDSSVVAHALVSYLRSISYQGELVLMHSDLGRTEWKDSIRMCRYLEDLLQVPLHVVRREAGDMVARWYQRWYDNLERYRLLRCAKLILPWSTASMRFCTSEMKTAICCRGLVDLFPGHIIYSVTGIRHDESGDRKNAPVLAWQKLLHRVKAGTEGYTWNPLVDWTLEDVLRYHEVHGLRRHQAYTVYETSRVSCCFCILSSFDDLLKASTCRDNQDVYRELVALEILSAFSFQSNRWLGDVDQSLLTKEQREGLAQAKIMAARRQEIEARLPKSVRFEHHYPTGPLSFNDAQILADVRAEIAALYQQPFLYTSAIEVEERFDELLEEKIAAEQEKEKKANKKAHSSLTIINPYTQEELWTP